MNSRYLARRAPTRRFKVEFAEDHGGFSSPILVGLIIVSLISAGGFLLFERIAQTANVVFVGDSTPKPQMVRMNFGPHDVSVPGNWLTSLPYGREETRQISMRIPYTDLKSKLGTAADPAFADSVVGFQLRKPDTTTKTQTIVENVYFPNSDPLPDGIAGLEKRQFKARSGYDSEILYTGRDGGNLFVARCLEAGKIEAKFGCLSVIRISSSLEVVLQFSQDMLPEWRRLDAASQEMIRDLLSS